MFDGSRCKVRQMVPQLSIGFGSWLVNGLRSGSSSTLGLYIDLFIENGEQLTNKKFQLCNSTLHLNLFYFVYFEGGRSDLEMSPLSSQSYQHCIHMIKGCFLPSIALWVCTHACWCMYKYNIHMICISRHKCSIHMFAHKSIAAFFDTIFIAVRKWTKMSSTTWISRNGTLEL